MRILLTSLLGGAAALAVAVGASLTGGAEPAQAQAGGHPVAVELFTSQGCSSCPPADAVLEKLVKDPRVVAFSRPVTYWDRLGWKDTLARETNTSLQRGYARRKIPGAGVYTPQAVVQGKAGLVGSREGDLRKLVDQASRAPEPTVVIVRRSDGARSVMLDGTAPGAAKVWVVAIQSSAMVKIGSGENGGRSVRYTNVALSDTAIGDWSGGKRQFEVPAAALKVAGADRYAVVVQQTGSGPILAARYL